MSTILIKGDIKHLSEYLKVTKLNFLDLFNRPCVKRRKLPVEQRILNLLKTGTFRKPRGTGTFAVGSHYERTGEERAYRED
jgi:hypothetical protein